MTAPPVDRLEAALTQLGAEHQPPAGWEDRVLAAVSEPPRRPWWKIAVPAFTLAVAAAVLVLVVFPREPSPLALEVHATGKVAMRGADRVSSDTASGSVTVGAVVHLRASGGGKRHAIRVYRNETDLVLRCPEDPVCQVSGDGIAADVTLSKVGGYLIVAFASSTALPVLPGTYDADTAAAHHAGAMVRQYSLQGM